MTDRTICRSYSGCDFSVDGANEQDELACGLDTRFRQDKHPYLD